MKIKLEIYGNNRLKSKYKLYTVDYNVIIIYYPYIFIYSIQRENRLEKNWKSRYYNKKRIKSKNNKLINSQSRFDYKIEKQ